LTSEVKRLELLKDTSSTRTESVALAITASLIDTSTGEIVWTNEASHNAPLGSAGRGTRAEVAEQRAMDSAIKPVVQKLVASIRDANLLSWLSLRHLCNQTAVLVFHEKVEKVGYGV